MNKDLPIGWVRVCISDIGEVVTGNTPPTNQKERFYGGEIPFVKPPDLDAGDFLDFASETLTHQGSLQARLLPPSSILVNCIGNVGKVAFSRVACCTNQQINSIVPDTRLVEPKFVYWSIRAPIFQDLLKSNTSATTVSIINKGRFSKLEIPLPPLNEQRRIVEKLDRIFDRLRRVRDELSHIKKLIDRYRQSVLTAAFRGDLTADWRVEKLSDSWYFDNVGNVSTKIHYGYTASSTSVDTGTKLLRITDIQNGTVDWETVPFCEITQTDELKYKLEMGDLLFARTGATVGKSFLIETEIPKAVFASYLIRIILGNNVIRKYVYYFFQSDLYWAQIRDNQIGTGQPNVNGKILSELMIPICPLEEQKEIVRRIEERFAKIEKIEQEYQKAVKLCDRLEQATLAKAFRGELVPQDPNDEPASVLLERIRAERAMLTQPRKKSPLRK